MIDFEQVPSPCYVLHEESLRQNLEELQRIAREADVQILLALKSFALPEALPLVGQYLSGITASSWNEAQLAQNHFPGQIHTYCPVYAPAEFDLLAEISSHLTFNSLRQWDTYREKAQQSKASCGLRVNPAYGEVGTALYNPAQPGSRFGVTADELTDGWPSGIDGMHFHTLFEARAEVLERTWEAVEAQFGQFLPSLKWLNMGGGHGITQKNYDTDRLINLLKSIRKKYDLKVILEPGSAIAWETGWLVSTVLDVVENHGIRTALLDVSFTAHMPDCLEMPYRPNVLYSRESHDPQAANTYRLGGNSCLSGDYIGGNLNKEGYPPLGYYTFEQPLEVGQKVIFEDMMHYTIVKTTMFNGVQHPAIGVWRDGRFELIREFGFADYRNRMS